MPAVPYLAATGGAGRVDVPAALPEFAQLASATARAALSATTATRPQVLVIEDPRGYISDDARAEHIGGLVA
jgi:hypothetical protein